MNATNHLLVLQTLIPRVTAALWLSMIVSGCVSTGPVAPRSEISQVAIEVLYATDRMVDNPEKLKDFYGSRRGEMQYGSCRVSINTGKNGITNHANPGLWEIDQGDHVFGDTELRRVNVVNSTDFPRYLATLAGVKEDKSALVFIHGYAMDFERAVSTTAKLTYELSYPGVPVLFSWPSNSSPAAYTGDTSAMDWSTPHLREFLDQLTTIKEVKTVHLIAHSLGNRGLLTALLELIDSKDAGSWKFGEIVLIAPDVDVDIFVRDIAPRLTETNSRVTLYVSARDFPLYLSRKLNLYPRVGDSNIKPLIFDGIETIDASNAISMEEGHAYFRKDPEVLSDIYYLINQRLGADDRPTLMAIERPEGRYWQVRKAEKGSLPQ